MRRILLLVCLVGPAAAGAGPAVPGSRPKPLWLVVTRPALAGAAAPLAAHRRAEGFETVVTTKPVATAIAGAPRPPAFVLLLGDDEAGREDAPWYVPARRLPKTRWGPFQDREFASDAAWGDLDGDLLPDLPVGRIPARTEAEAERIVAKILAFEKRRPAASDLRLVVWGGATLFGKVADALATGFLTGTLRRYAPRWLGAWVMSSIPGSPFCGWPADQPATFAAEMRRGALLTAIVSHGSPDHAFGMRTKDGRRVTFGAGDVAGRGSTPSPTPPLVILACSCGKLDRPEPCLAEKLLSHPAGPVAVVAATTESHPLPNIFSARAMLQALGRRRKRLGTLWLDALRRMVKTRDFLLEAVLRGVEGSSGEETDVVKLERDQALLYAVFGDPATRLEMPDALAVSVTRTEKGRRFEVVRPRGADRLTVWIRPPPVRFAPGVGTVPDRRTATARFREANRSLAYRLVASYGPRDAWRGEVAEAGDIRLVATGPGVFAAAVIPE